MSILDFAMQMEQDGEKLYRGLADTIENTGLKKIFTMLADEEAEHFKVFKHLKENTPLGLPENKILEQSKNIFSAMKEGAPFTINATTEQKEAYSLALEMEKKSIDFYEEKAAVSQNKEEKKLLRAIAREERRHYRLIEGVIDFISRPEQWLEDAEYVQLTEY